MRKLINLFVHQLVRIALLIHRQPVIKTKIEKTNLIRLSNDLVTG